MEKMRIGSGLGFYGDSWQPIRATIESGDVQYVASDHLAELTLAILQKDRLKDPSAGYTKDLVPMLSELYPLAKHRRVKFILNAGGLNPLGAQAALAAAFSKQGWSARIAAVTGDSVLERVDELQQAGVTFAHLDSGASFSAVRARTLFANAYLGAKPIVDALRQGADIVITGRVADAALFLAPMIHEFGWRFDDLNKLAQGVLVGHLLECSGQGSGGNYGGDWENVPDLAHIGYPIAEVTENGDALITKVEGTGGRIDYDTVREQMLYETHNPRRYISPDVVVDMGTSVLRDLGHDRVSLTGTVGYPKPESLKVLAGYEDGYMADARVGYSWPDALAKARSAAAIVQTQMQEAGIAVDESLVEYQGYDSLHGTLSDPEHADQLNEVYLRIAIRTRDRGTASRFGRIIPPLFLSGPPFVTMGGVNPPKTLLGIWPTLVARERVEERVQVHMVTTP